MTYDLCLLAAILAITVLCPVAAYNANALSARRSIQEHDNADQDQSHD